MTPMFTEKFAFCSNFYPSIVTMYGKQYPTVEHAYQAAKCKHPNDRALIRNAASAGLAKKYGRMVELCDDWSDEKRIDIMFTLVSRKFKILELKEQLMSTQGIYLAETNYWHDNFWGDCYCDNCRKIVGRNELGKILMLNRDKPSTL